MIEIDKLRSQIDELDKWILVLLKKRFDITDKIGNLKKQNSLEIVDQNRWDNVLKNIKKISQEIKLGEEISTEIYNKIHELSCEKQKS